MIMKKGFKTLIAGIATFVVGGFVLPFFWVLPLILNSTNSEQFIVPSTQTFEIEEPGKYVLWHDYQTFFEGSNYSKPEALPDGLEISVKNATGDTLFFKTDTNTSFTSGSHSKNSIAYLEFDQPETISISVNGDFESRVFSFGESFIGKFFLRIFSAVALSAVLSALGIALGVWGIVKLIKEPATNEPA